MKLTYRRCGDYYLPNIGIPAEDMRPLGKYGRMRMRYLREHRSLLFNQLLLSGKLMKHLYSIDNACQERMDLLIPQMKAAEGVTEALKAADQMEWVRRMNSTHNRIEEMLFNELIYYTRKKHVIYTEVMLPPNAPQEYADRSLLWNSVEWNETKANAQLARSIELALPAELNHEQNIALVRKLAQKLFVDKGMCADVAFHDKGDGNPHAHILLTMRPLTPDGKWGDKSRLEYILDADGNRIPAKQKGRWKTRKVCTTDWDDRGNTERWRAAAADAINEALREAGFTQGFVDPRSYADQGVQRIPMVHEGPDARAMEKRGIPTEVGDKNREIRQQNKLLNQLEARLARLNAWAQYEKKKDELLIAQGEDVSRESLRFKLASNILASNVQPNRKDHRLRDSTGLLSIMHEYNITDAASCLAAIQTVNTKLYGLKSKRKENHDLSLELSVRIESYEKWKKYQKHYRAWEKLPEAKRGGFERKYEYELRQYRQAASVLRRCQDDGEKIDYQGWKAALEYLEKEQFMLDYQLEDMKEEVRRLEVVKREFIQENKRTKPERYAW